MKVSVANNNRGGLKGDELKATKNLQAPPGLAYSCRPRVGRGLHVGFLAAALLMLGVIDSSAAAASRERKVGVRSGSIECAVCHAMAVEVQYELEKTANSTEVIELSRRPSSDLGKQQYQKGGRAIKYVDSEMRITDALQAACQTLKRFYRVQTIGGRRRLVLGQKRGDHSPPTDLDGIEWSSGGEKVLSVCEELAEERERDFIDAVRSTVDLAGAVCFGGAKKSNRSSKAGVCGNDRTEKCPPGEFSFSTDGSGVEPCWECEKGKFQSQSGATACIACATNHSTPSRASTSEKDCRTLCFKGSYGTGGGVFPCEPCPLHTYQMHEGASECVECPSGKGTRSLGSVDHLDCMPICGDGRKAGDEGSVSICAFVPLKH